MSLTNQDLTYYYFLSKRMLMIRQVTVNDIPKTIINGLGLSIAENTGVIAVAKNTTAILLINSANCLSCLLLNFGIFQLAAVSWLPR